LTDALLDAMDCDTFDADNKFRVFTFDVIKLLVVNNEQVMLDSVALLQINNGACTVTADD